MIKRTKQFAIDCGHLILSLPNNVINYGYSAQLVNQAVLLVPITALPEERNPRQILSINLK